ncbi:MAG: hypothetical protein SOR77_07375 [Peptoniphilus sp.]|uniref:hypothetical protein n=1 Tax=Peptoniphilus sp. TaxID=1971214 RepID=UPI002A75C80B|nr:hypothetical protein [Peptoniphilus sp.]MDY2987438.1 hypothetical protein [Peptoniphilus sp.]
MDWYKAKKILIIALITTNILLFGMIILRSFIIQDRTTSYTFIKQVNSRLLEKGINIHSKIPRTKISLPSLRVEFDSYSKLDLNERFFASRGKFQDPNSSFTQITYADEILSVLNTRRLIYENVNPKISTKSKLKAEDVAKKFLLDRNFDVSNMLLVYSNSSNGQTELKFAKEFEGVILERSFANFIIKGDTVVSMDRLWLNVIDKSTSIVHMHSAPRALLTLLSEPEMYSKTITRIEECYYFDPEEQGYVEDITKATEGKAIAAWRIQFSDGESTEIESK